MTDAIPMPPISFPLQVQAPRRQSRLGSTVESWQCRKEVASSQVMKKGSVVYYDVLPIPEAMPDAISDVARHARAVPDFSSHRISFCPLAFAREGCVLLRAAAWRCHAFSLGFPFRIIFSLLLYFAATFFISPEMPILLPCPEQHMSRERYYVTLIRRSAQRGAHGAGARCSAIFCRRCCRRR